MLQHDFSWNLAFMFISNHLICWLALKNYAKESFSRLKMLVTHVCYIILNTTRKSRNFHVFTQTYLAHAQTNFLAASLSEMLTLRRSVTYRFCARKTSYGRWGVVRGGGERWRLRRFSVKNCGKFRQFLDNF